MEQVQYISDANANITGVIVPIKIWRELQSERETAYLLKSEAMRERLLTARKRNKGVSLGEALEKLGI